MKIETRYIDVLRMLDVFEHVRDPYTFLEFSKEHARKFVFHIPLGLSYSSVLRNNPLINIRRSVGHLHFYTKDIELETLTDFVYKIIHWEYSNSSFIAPNPSILTKILRPLKRLLYLINKDVTVRVLGGETLIVLAE